MTQRNVVITSPHFPPNLARFVFALKKAGANVLGIADAPWEQLSPELRSALTEYYRVNKMDDYSEMYRALAFLSFKHGRIWRIESHNEWWLETDARLRTDFNIAGLKHRWIEKARRKSTMKAVFKGAGIRVARGCVIKQLNEAIEFIRDIGLPVVAKPDKGVGASDTHLLKTEKDVEEFFKVQRKEEYIFEEFIKGDVETFDGLVNREGKIIFSTSHRYSHGVMETVNEDVDSYYYNRTVIPADVEDAGTRVVRAFDIKERFFHIEFFRDRQNRIVGLEINLRPPGGLTMDMFNFSCDADFYQAWADIVLDRPVADTFSRKYCVIFVGRKDKKNYLRSHSEVMAKYGRMIVHHEKLPELYARAMGSYAYLLRSESEDEVVNAANWILEKK